MKKIILIMISTFHSLFFAYGQIKNFENAPSPNSLAQGISLAFPPSASNGIPSISVPIYTIIEDGFDIPISLNYNPNLVKPDVHPGWVGLGWNLSVGGTITRVIQGKADEKPKGLLLEPNRLSASDWATYLKLKAATDHTYANNSANQLDYIPDEFSFSFLQYSGSFYVDETGSWKVRSDHALSVLVETEGADLLAKFIVKDISGNTFEFKTKETSGSMLEGTILYPEIRHNRTWYLDKITNRYGASIYFEYTQGSDLIVPHLHSYNGYQDTYFLLGSRTTTQYLTRIVTDLQIVEFGSSVSNELKYDHNDFSDQLELWNYEYFSSGYLIGPFMKANGITVMSLSGVQNLINSMHYKKLDKITVKEKSSNEVIKEFKFIYSNGVSERLKLRSISNLGSNPYFFEYTDDYNSNLKLPKYFSGKTDWWGYYNGRDLNFSSEVLFNASKEPHDINIKSEVLRKIQFPTGGFVKYEFEMNDYSKSVSTYRYDPLIEYTSNKIGGGLRIKEITFENSDNTIANSLKYIYRNYNGTLDNIYESSSSGILGGGSYYGYGITAGNPQCLLINGGPAVMANQGGIVGYSEVIELNSNGSITVSQFSNFDKGTENEFMDAEPIYKMERRYDAFTSKLYERGRLLLKSNYKLHSSQFKKVDEIRYQYLRLNEADDYVRSYKISFVAGVNGLTEYKSSAIKINTYSYKLGRIEEIIYDQTEPGNDQKKSITSTDFSYFSPWTSSIPKDQNPRKITKTLQSGEKIVKENKYPIDYYFSAVPVDLRANGVYSLKQLGINILPIETISYLEEFYAEGFEPSKTIFEGSINTYKVFNNSKTILWENYKLNTGSVGLAYSSLCSGCPFKWSTITSNNFIFSSNTYKLVTTYNNYDDFCNLLSFTPENGVGESLTWDYNNSLLKSSSKNPGVNEHKNLYTHKPLVGLTKITDPNFRDTKFFYDKFNRFKISTDHDNNIQNRYRYHYNNQTEWSNSFTSSGFNSIGYVINFTANDVGEIGNIYIWDFGDGVVIETNQAEVTHQYTTTGAKTVKLSKVNKELGTIQSIQQLFIQNAPLYLDAQLNEQSPCSSTYDLTAIVYGGCSGALSYEWYSDRTGTILLGSGSSLSYNAFSGNNTITCIVTDSCGVQIQGEVYVYGSNDPNQLPCQN